MKRGKYIGTLHSHFEFVEILLSERSADWSPPCASRKKIHMPTFNLKADDIIPGADMMKSLSGQGLPAAEDDKDELTLAGLTSLTKSLDYSPFASTNKVLRCQAR